MGLGDDFSRDTLDGLPFVTVKSGGKTTVSWVDVGSASVGVIGVAFFDGLADLVASTIGALFVGVADTVASNVGALANEVASFPGGTLSLEPALSFASDFGYVGAVVVVGLGVFIVALAVEAVQ